MINLLPYFLPFRGGLTIRVRRSVSEEDPRSRRGRNPPNGEPQLILGRQGGKTRTLLDLYKVAKKPEILEKPLEKDRPKKVRFIDFTSPQIISVDTIRPIKKQVDRRPLFKPFALVIAGAIFIFIFSFLIFSLFKQVSFSKIDSFLQLSKMLTLSGRYLILFQNNNEIRPSGGFLGSFAEVQLDKGQMKNIYFETNIYKRDNEFSQIHKILPPKSFQILYGAPYWTMRDANWAADFQEAARNVAWFYEQEGGNQVDGVMALDTTLFTKLLELSGPINLPKYNKTITSENFLEIVQYEVEKGYFEKNETGSEPKTILKDLAEQILPKIANLPKTKLLKLTLEMLEQKHLMFYFTDPTLENALLEQNWAGAISQTSADYLYVLNSTINLGDDPVVNQGGGKTNLSIKEVINYKISKNEKGLVATLTISRTHLGSWQWPDGQNNNFVRILVPKESQLLSANLDGQDISKEIYTTSESGKTSFGTWVKTQPQTSKILTITYQLPFQTWQNYQLVVQKQPGALASDLQVIYENKVLYDGELSKDLEINLK